MGALEKAGAVVVVEGTGQSTEVAEKVAGGLVKAVVAEAAGEGCPVEGCRPGESPHNR